MQLIWLHDIVTHPGGIYNQEAQGQSDCNPIHPDGGGGYQLFCGIS